ncbi:ribosomal protein L7 [Acrasis kona]|uniref:Ribosomal protein L7 n=1 Tax=Acrasis kona TaxID=1008807 RepID=A0AAW2ZED6_9EUKA
MTKAEERNTEAAKVIQRKKPETILKSRRTTIERERLRLQQGEQKRKDAKPRRLVFRRAERFATQFRRAEDSEKRQSILTQAHRGISIQDENKLAFVVRIRGIQSATPKMKKILQLLRLRSTNNGVFLRLNKPTINLLRVVEPYVTFGFPTIQNVRDLIYKCGNARVNDHRVAITGNAIIERELQKYNIISVEDLIDELWNLGENFVAVNNFLWPFKLRAPKEGYENVRKEFVKNGSYGNRGDSMPDLIQKML